ncbi:OsmC family protein [Microbacterium sp.]|uniref:OsmC family protein n=1 Tax=Microbacterium sp. TaxID=51671 RepID=UPI003A8FA2A6
MSEKYRTAASNSTSEPGVSRVDDGMTVHVSSPLNPDRDMDATNPEQLLALAWATCLNSTAQAVTARKHRTAVRVEIVLRDASEGSGYEFAVDAYLSVEGASPEETERVLEQAHARCPISKLLRSATTVAVHGEPYAVD